MKGQAPKKFDHVIHPYVFVLKEGKGIQHDFLDYSLLLLQVGHADIIPSPRHLRVSSPIIQLLNK